MGPETLAQSHRALGEPAGGLLAAQSEFEALGLGTGDMIPSAGDAGWLNAVGEGMVRWLWADELELDEALAISD